MDERLITVTLGDYTYSAYALEAEESDYSGHSGQVAIDSGMPMGSEFYVAVTARSSASIKAGHVFTVTKSRQQYVSPEGITFMYNGYNSPYVDVWCPSGYSLSYSETCWVSASWGGYCRVTDTTKTSYGTIATSVRFSYQYSDNVTVSSRVPINSLYEDFNSRGCFEACRNLVTAPTIPSDITNVRRCFSYCSSLTGNIIVNNNPTEYSKAFYSTTKNIFVINGGTANVAKWKSIAGQMANVHYEAEDNPTPAISDFKVTRVSNNGSIEFDPTGLYAYVQAKLMIYDNLIPVGWTNELKGITLKDDGKVRSVVWQPKIADYPADVYCWVYLGDTSTHNLSLQIADSIKDDDGIERNSRSSDILTQTIPKSYVLIDYYHDETTNTEGMAIGKYAEVADLLDVDMPALFRQNLAAENILLELDTTEPPDTSTTDGQIYQALINLNWTDVIV